MVSNRRSGQLIRLGVIAALAAGVTACEPKATPTPVSSVKRKPVQQDWDRISTQLNPRMSEDEVRQLAGVPYRTEFGPCGPAGGKPAYCKTWVYGTYGYGRELRIRFGESGPAGSWAVNGWTTGNSIPDGGHVIPDAQPWPPI